jgi:hypothetical protein
LYAAVAPSGTVEDDLKESAYEKQSERSVDDVATSDNALRGGSGLWHDMASSIAVPTPYVFVFIKSIETQKQAIDAKTSKLF